jgi:hypothetical protein
MGQSGMGQSATATVQSPPVKEDKDLNRLMVGAVSLAMIVAGMIVMITCHSIDTVRRHFLSILALTFMAPLILLLSYFKVISADGTTAVVGAMAAYFFGTGRSAARPGSDD